MICWLVKSFSKSQEPWKTAIGVPKVDVSGWPEAIQAGMFAREKNQTLMASEVNSIAYTPPPNSLKASPKLPSVPWTVQPPEPTSVEQAVAVNSPASLEAGVEMSHESSVCRAI